VKAAVKVQEGWQPVMPEQTPAGWVARIRQGTVTRSCEHTHKYGDTAQDCSRQWARELNRGLRPDHTDFYVTFGQQYPREQHPVWADADHDGWVRITARSYDAAMTVARKHLGVYWSNIYGADVWDADRDHEFYPKGELAHFTQEA
jgi:hypothetical protein